MSNSVLVVFSGGLDSTTALYWAKKSFNRVEAVSFDYGAKHNAIELNRAKAAAERAAVPHVIIPLGFIGEHFRSALLNGEIPDGDYNAENMSETVVPFRNGIMLAAAVGLAESRGIDAVVLGNHAGDHFIYADCRQQFIEAFNAAAQAGTDGRVSILSPFCKMTKAQIVSAGNKLGVPFAATWSCYKGGRVHCGVCGTCRERKEAFAIAGIADPTEYEK